MRATITARVVFRIAVALGFTLAFPAVPIAEDSDDPPGVSAGWMAEVKQQIAESEYQVTWQGKTAIAGVEAAYQAPNPVHGLRTYFTESGIRVFPKSDSQPSWEWALTLAGYGRAGVTRAVDQARLRVDGNRVEYDRGTILEWYVNDRRGLEQGFTLTAPASITEKTKHAGFVHVELALGGTLSPIISADGQAVDFATTNGARVLHYASLVVRDAKGQELRAWMEGWNHDGQRGIRISFDDSEATYPITVDPLATIAAWTAESDRAHAHFAVSVAPAGDVNGDGYGDVIVGAFSFEPSEPEEGRAFVYYGSPAGLQTTASWTVQSDQAGAQFGRAVAGAGDVNGDGFADVIVGAHLHDNGQTDEGRAYVYYGSATGLQTTPGWMAESNRASAGFGVSVASAGDVNGDGFSDIIVGAENNNNGETNEVRAYAYVYYGSAAGLQAEAGWMAEDEQARACAGTSVASAGDINGDGYADVIVGTEKNNTNGLDEERVRVFHGSAAGLQTTAALTLMQTSQVEVDFGFSVATAGDVNGDGFADIIVGAPAYRNTGLNGAGRAFVYQGSAGGLQPVPAWTADLYQGQNPITGARVGYAVATAGDVNGDGYADVIVGAGNYSNGALTQGRAYVFFGSATGLPTSPAWTTEGNQANALFGNSVATAGDVNGDGFADVIVGAYSYDNGQTDEGRAYAYHGSAAGLQTAAGWTAVGESQSEFGTSVATAGDVNGDGYADVLVGAPKYVSGSNIGAVLLYYGSAAGLSTVPAWSAYGPPYPNLAEFGSAVATAGDVNGDGYSDVIVGAYRFDDDQADEGRAYVYLGSAAGLQPVPPWTVDGNESGAWLGMSVATAGDVNGDGYADVVVGAPGESVTPHVGRALAFYGSPTGLNPAPAWTAQGQLDSWFGHSVATAGDVNRDGYADVIVGAPWFENGQSDEGCAFVYHGSAAGLQSGASWTTESNRNFGVFGWTVASAGDVNGDGYADVLVGAPNDNNGQAGEGRAFVYHGSVAGLQAVPAWTVESDLAGASMGRTLASAGDVNGDGYSDVIIGAEDYNDVGRHFAYHGSAAGLLSTASWTVDGDDSPILYFSGGSVATAGDVNGDGYADVIIGTPAAGDDGHGVAFTYYGNGGRGVSLRPQQRRATGAEPIAPLGASDTDSFRLALLARSPFGRGRVTLQWEAKPLGALLDGVGTHSSGSASDTGTSGAALSEEMTDLVAATPYHWRVRMRYDAVTTPFALYSRWLTVPWRGWQEAMLRTGSTAAGGPAGRVPDGSNKPPLLVAKSIGGQITLSWGDSCVVTDTDYAIYEGALGNFTSHASRFCSTGGARSKTFTPLGENEYILIVPSNQAFEGSYGTNSSGVERPASVNACMPQMVGVCQ